MLDPRACVVPAGRMRVWRTRTLSEMRLLWEMHRHRVGDQVHPSEAAHEVGLAPGEDRCNAAVAYLERA